MAVPVVVVTQGGVPVTFVDPSGAAAVLGLTVGTTPISGGTTGYVLYDNAGVVGERPGIAILGSGVGGSVSSGTAETQLASIAVPAASMGANGSLRITCQWSYTNSGNSKQLRVRLGGASGTQYYSAAVTTTANANIQITIRNNNSASAQKGFNIGTSAVYNASANALITSTVNTASVTTVYISGQTATGGETITLESYLVELIPGD